MRHPRVFNAACWWTSNIEYWRDRLVIRHQANQLNARAITNQMIRGVRKLIWQGESYAHSNTGIYKGFSYDPLKQMSFGFYI